jgi:exopolysaccharide production protein ExoQ
MKIAKAIFVNPDHNFWYGLMAVALSMFVFAYSARFGKISVLAYYACWLPLLLIDYRRLLSHPGNFLWIVALAGLACLSTFWSQAPSTTARAGIQFMSQVVCALIAARTVGIRTLTFGAAIGICAVVLYSFVFGHYDYDPLDGTYSFVGAFDSKNQLGLFASLGIYFAFAGLVILHEGGLARLLMLACGVMSAVALAKANSATSVLAVAVTLATLICLKLAMLFSPLARKCGLIAGGLLVVVAVMAALNMGAFNFVLGIFGKDSTLTGRTYLWAQGWAASAQAPVFGVGYQAYWVQGFSEAERLWKEFYIGSRSGFHFHNTYIEVLVELGAVGFLLIAIMMIRVPFGLLRRLISARGDPAAFVTFGIAFMFLVRSFVEVDVINPYVVGSFLLYYAAGLLASPLPRPEVVTPAASYPPLWRSAT